MDLFLTPYDGVERAFAGELSQVRRVLFERLELCVAALVVYGAGSTLPEIGVFRALVSEAQVAQDARRETRRFAMECQEHGAGTDEAVSQIVGFLFRHTEHFRCLRRDEDLE